MCGIAGLILSPGAAPPAALVDSFDGLGAEFAGPQGSLSARNPSDNSLAVGPNHIVQIVNSQTAIFTKKGKRFEKSGVAVYGPVATNNVFKGFGGACEARNNGDAVVRYDQLADRWLIVMPIFRRDPSNPARPAAPRSGGPALVSVPGRRNQPGPAAALVAPAALTSAIEDALAPFGAKVTEQYLPPARILELAGVIAGERR
jgi:hypothetical protein